MLNPERRGTSSATTSVARRRQIEVFKQNRQTAPARKSPQPVLDLEPINALKLPFIIRHQHHFERQRLRCDQKVIWSN